MQDTPIKKDIHKERTPNQHKEIKEQRKGTTTKERTTQRTPTK